MGLCTRGLESRDQLGIGGFADRAGNSFADWSGNKDTRKSTSGYVLYHCPLVVPPYHRLWPKGSDLDLRVAKVGRTLSRV